MVRASLENPRHPEDGQGGQDRALIRDFGPEDEVENAEAVGGHKQEMQVVSRQGEGVAHLALVQPRQARRGQALGQRLSLNAAGTFAPICPSEMCRVVSREKQRPVKRGRKPCVLRYLMAKGKLAVTEPPERGKRIAMMRDSMQSAT